MIRSKFFRRTDCKLLKEGSSDKILSLSDFYSPDSLYSSCSLYSSDSNNRIAPFLSCKIWKASQNVDIFRSSNKRFRNSRGFRKLFAKSGH